jgi:hypothetical protein
MNEQKDTAQEFEAALDALETINTPPEVKTPKTKGGKAAL